MRLRVAALLFAPLALIAVVASPAAAQVRIYPPYYPAPSPYGYPYRYYSGPESDLRLDIKPKQAAVYVDGYYAGQVDDYDGVFQRLHLAPGTHELVVYLQGFRSLHERLYLGPNTDRKISAKLEPLRPGEANEPIPVPAEPPQVDGGDRPMLRGFAPRGPGRYGPPQPPPPPPQDGRGPDAAGPAARDAGTVGSVVIRVQPGGSDVVIDGEHWSAPARAEDRLVVQLESGHHVVEVHKTGFRDFRTEVDVRAGETSPVNLSLTPDR